MFPVCSCCVLLFLTFFFLLILSMDFRYAISIVLTLGLHLHRCIFKYLHICQCLLQCPLPYMPYLTLWDKISQDSAQLKADSQKIFKSHILSNLTDSSPHVMACMHFLCNTFQISLALSIVCIICSIIHSSMSWKLQSISICHSVLVMMWSHFQEKILCMMLIFLGSW